MNNFSNCLDVSNISDSKFLQIEAASASGSLSMLVNIASRVLVPKQMKQFITKLVKEEIVSKLLDKQVTLDEIAVNVSFSE